MRILCSDDMNDVTRESRDVSLAGTSTKARKYRKGLYSSAFLNTTARVVPGSYFAAINVEIVASDNSCSISDWCGGCSAVEVMSYKHGKGDDGKAQSWRLEIPSS